MKKISICQKNGTVCPLMVTSRFQIVGILQCWVGMRTRAECTDASKLQWDLPPFSQKQTDNCVPDTSGYPWGQTGNGGDGVSTTAAPPMTTTVAGGVVPKPTTIGPCKGF